MKDSTNQSTFLILLAVVLLSVYGILEFTNESSNSNFRTNFLPESENITSIDKSSNITFEYLTPVIVNDWRIKW